MNDDVAALLNQAIRSLAEEIRRLHEALDRWLPEENHEGERG